MSNFEDKILKEAIEAEIKNDNPQSFAVGVSVPWSDITPDNTQREWIWENYLAKRHITLLAALWKAGKSTFLRCLLLAMMEQEEFAGQPTTKCKVMIISEESPDEWLDQREDIDPELIKDIYIKIRPLSIKPNVRQWIKFIEVITQECVEKGISLVVIDTLSTFWPIDNENDSAQVMKALVPLYKFTDNDMSVLLVHHFRKGGGDQAQASRGSGALTGFVSNIIEFTRSDSGNFYQRTLKNYGRFREVIPQVVIELTPEGKYKTLGEPWQVSKNARLAKTINIVEKNAPLSVTEIFNIWAKETPDITLRSVRNYVKELLEKKILSDVDSRLVGKKRTSFYALTGNYAQQRKMDLPLIEGGFLSSVLGPENDPDSLSAVDSKTVPPAQERKGLNPKDKLIDDEIRHY